MIVETKIGMAYGNRQIFSSLSFSALRQNLDLQYLKSAKVEVARLSLNYLSCDHGNRRIHSETFKRGYERCTCLVQCERLIRIAVVVKK
jgi:hypothetical protein